MHGHVRWTGRRLAGGGGDVHPPDQFQRAAVGDPPGGQLVGPVVGQVQDASARVHRQERGRRPGRRPRRRGSSRRSGRRNRRPAGCLLRRRARPGPATARPPFPYFPPCAHETAIRRKTPSGRPGGWFRVNFAASSDHQVRARREHHGPQLARQRAPDRHQAGHPRGDQGRRHAGRRSADGPGRQRGPAAQGRARRAAGLQRRGQHGHAGAGAEGAAAFARAAPGLRGRRAGPPDARLRRCVRRSAG